MDPKLKISNPSHSQPTDPDMFIWILSILQALSYSTMFANMVSLAANFIDVTKAYSLSFGLGCFAGMMIIPKASELILNHTNIWFYFNVVFNLVGLVFILVFMGIGNFLRKKQLLRPEFCDPQ